MKPFTGKNCFGLLIIALLVFFNCTGTPERPENPAAESHAQTDEDIEISGDDEPQDTISQLLPPPVEQELNLPVSSFREIWVYVMAGREDALKEGLPISDIGYFAAEIDSYGKLTDVPVRRNISYPARVHLVAVCNSYSLTHFVLMPGSRERKELIADLLTASRNFDGLQIDFEHIPKKDGEPFLSFLKELRAGLGNKMFTIALPARTRKLANDINDYETIKPIVDRIIVMAYDEHWSGSKPGSVASMNWCRQVADYSVKTIGRDKLVMGIPFYGRAWGDHNPSRALIYSTTENLINQHNVTDIKRENGVPYFDYNVNISVKVYYDDVISLSARMEMYKSMNAAAIGFWRLGQETPKVWDFLRLE